MSAAAAVSDVYCYACSQLYASAEFPAEYNEENDRICPQCSSDFVELRQAPAPVAPAAGALPSILNNVGTNTTRRVFTTPNGLNMELHVTTAVLPQDMYDMLSRSGSQGVSMVFSVDNAGSLIPAGNFRGLNFGDAEFDALLDRLVQQYRPPMQPTSEQVVNALPRRHVRAGQADGATSGDAASCRPGEPCSVCHDEFSEGITVVELPCQHCFHEDCILPWLREHNTCPVCRFKLDEDNTSSSGTGGSNYPADSPTDAIDEGDQPIGLEPAWLDRYLPRRPRAPRSSQRAGPAGSATGDANASLAGSSPHPVRSSPGAAFVRTGPYTRLEEAPRTDAAGRVSSQDVRGAPAYDSSSSNTTATAASSLATSTANLTASGQAIDELRGRISNLTQQNASSQQAIDDLNSRIGSITQRHATNQQAFTDLMGDITRLTQRRQSLMGSTQELHASHRHLRERMETLLLQSQALHEQQLSAPHAASSRPAAFASAAEQDLAELQDSFNSLLQQRQVLSGPIASSSAASSTSLPSTSSCTTSSLAASSNTADATTARTARAAAAAGTSGRTVQRANSESPAVSADGQPGSHMGDLELQAFEQDVSRAAALAESMLNDLPRGVPAAPATAAAAPGAGVGAAMPVPGSGAVVVAVGDAGEGALALQQQARVPAVRVPLLARVVGNVLRWAFRNVRRVFGLLR